MGSLTVPTIPSSQHPVERFFECSLYLLMLTGFLTLASTGKLDPLSILMVGAALLVRGLLLRKNETIQLSETFTTRLTIGYVLFYALDFFVISREFVNATVHLVLFSMVVKIFSIHRTRDYVYLTVLSFAMILSAAILTVESTFLFLFAIFLMLAITTFVSFEMKRSMASALRTRGHDNAPPTGLLTSSLSKTAALLVIAILVFGSGIFFVLPRVSTGYLSNFAPRNELTTGFSDQVELGKIGEIKQTDSIVFRVQFDGEQRTDVSNLLWRGMALTNFDGHKWSSPQEIRLMPRAIGSQAFRVPQDLFLSDIYLRRQRQEFEAIRREPALVHDIPPQGDWRLPTALSFRVLMEPIGTAVFFVPSYPSYLTTNLRLLGIDSTGTIYNMDRDRQINAYTGMSQAYTPAPELHGDTPALALRNLQLPPLDPRVRELAQQVTAGAATDEERAQRIEQYLLANFGYTLQLPAEQQSDPIAHFLFERRKGHCEFFASSMAVMLRSIGVPSRIVNGFRMGDFNDLTGSWVVRSRNAHSWVEAYIPGFGWKTYDPTPADPAVPVTTFSRMQLYLEAASEFWRQWVVNYDFGQQRKLTQQVNGITRNVQQDARGWWTRKYASWMKRAKALRDRALRSPQSLMLTAVLGLASLLLLFNLARLVRWMRNRSLAKHPSRSPEKAATLWYERLNRHLSRRGWRRSPAQTPREFAGSIGDAALRTNVERFTAHYERARFGESAQDAQKLPEIFEEIAGKK